MANILNKLTEGIVNRNVEREGAALLDKWTKTGLLEGLNDDHSRQSMAVLLENQAKELLRESNSMGGESGGAVQGFAAVSFPIVRRVFGGLLANDLVSVQPMSLPSGLIFFLDFTRTDDRGPDEAGESVHGQGVVGSQITEGVTLDDTGFYNLSQGYSHARGACGSKGLAVVESFRLNTTDLASTETANLKAIGYDIDLLAEAAAHGAQTAGGTGSYTEDGAMVTVMKWEFDGTTSTYGPLTTGDYALELDFGGTKAEALAAHTGAGAEDAILQFDRSAVMGFDVATTGNEKIIRRLTKAKYAATESSDGKNDAGRLMEVSFVLVDASPGATGTPAAATAATRDVSFVITDNITEVQNGLGALAAQPIWELESSLDSPFGTDGMNIPEIDIKVDSVAITAGTRKLKAKWTPELGQDLNAYHNLDAEVELTSVLSEQIALEIDQEILKDLIEGAKAGTKYWSRKVGVYITNQEDGSAGTVAAGSFTGTISEWYESLIETINDVSAQIHRKTLRGGANFLVCGPEVANILEFTSGFRASVPHDDDKGTVGGYKDGSINKKWDLYVDPYFPRNLILVGRKGSSFLESGYVYSPYVPLQTTPTIFGPEDFTPRKGVMTRYGKKMVRPDMYGLVYIRDYEDR